MATLIQRIAQTAYRTFSKEIKDYSDSGFQEKIAVLSSLVNNVTAKDVNFDRDLVLNEKPVSFENGVPPVTYIHLWDDGNFSMGIFVLKRGARLPLHDHPGMLGFCKVIHGSVTLKTYSLVELDGLASELNAKLKRLREVGVIREAFKHVVRDVTPADSCVVLTPTNSNIHEICADSGPVAFLDILAPPYDESTGTRLCHYFRDAGQIVGSDGGYVWLEHISQPMDYWCDSAPYLGPEINPGHT